MQITNLSPTAPQSSSAPAPLHAAPLFFRIFSAIKLSCNNNRIFTQRIYNRHIITFIGGALLRPVPDLSPVCQLAGRPARRRALPLVVTSNLKVAPALRAISLSNSRPSTFFCALLNNASPKLVLCVFVMTIPMSLIK